MAITLPPPSEQLSSSLPFLAISATEILFRELTQKSDADLELILNNWQYSCRSPANEERQQFFKANPSVQEFQFLEEIHPVLEAKLHAVNPSLDAATRNAIINSLRVNLRSLLFTLLMVKGSLLDFEPKDSRVYLLVKPYVLRGDKTLIAKNASSFCLQLNYPFGGPTLMKLLREFVPPFLRALELTETALSISESVDRIRSRGSNFVKGFNDLCNDEFFGYDGRLRFWSAAAWTGNWGVSTNSVFCSDYHTKPKQDDPYLHLQDSLLHFNSLVMYAFLAPFCKWEPKIAAILTGAVFLMDVNYPVMSFSAEPGINFALYKVFLPTIQLALFIRKMQDNGLQYIPEDKKIEIAKLITDFCEKLPDFYCGLALTNYNPVFKHIIETVFIGLELYPFGQNLVTFLSAFCRDIISLFQGAEKELVELLRYATLQQTLIILQADTIGTLDLAMKNYLAEISPVLKSYFLKYPKLNYDSLFETKTLFLLTKIFCTEEFFAKCCFYFVKRKNSPISYFRNLWDNLYQLRGIFSEQTDLLRGGILATVLLPVNGNIEATYRLHIVKLLLLYSNLAKENGKLDVLFPATELFALLERDSNIGIVLCAMFSDQNAITPDKPLFRPVLNYYLAILREDDSNFYDVSSLLKRSLHWFQGLWEKNPEIAQKYIAKLTKEGKWLDGDEDQDVIVRIFGNQENLTEPPARTVFFSGQGQERKRRREDFEKEEDDLEDSCISSISSSEENGEPAQKRLRRT